jgi:hypothetical protein
MLSYSRLFAASQQIAVIFMFSKLRKPENVVLDKVAVASANQMIHIWTFRHTRHVKALLSFFSLIEHGTFRLPSEARFFVSRLQSNHLYGVAVRSYSHMRRSNGSEELRWHPAN